MDKFLGEDSVFVLLAGIFALFMAVRSWTKGAMALLWALVSWGLGVGAGYWTFHNGMPILERYGGWKVEGGMTIVVSVALAIFVFSLTRILAKAFFEKVFGPDTVLGGWMYGGSGALLSFIPTAAVLMLMAVLIRNNGTMWELNEIDKIVANHQNLTKDSYPEEVVSVRWRNAVEGLPQGTGVLDLVDPLSSVPKRNLAALALAGYHADLRAKLAANRDTEDIMSHEDVVAMLANPDLIELVEGKKGGLKYFDLIRNKEIRKVLQDRELKKQLGKIDMADEIREVITANPNKRRIPWLEKIFS